MGQNNLWEILNKMTAARPIDQQALSNIAKGVKQGDQHNDEKMKQLVRSLSALLGMNLTPEKEADILSYLKKNQFTGIESIQKLLKNSGKS
ncbi:stage VI sporulation protein F [Thermicanus aegyptius]|uniref:stage VI sporulation protein F n=1 Tax=Thermicanus aegyptius TaxID=94009 RepID=UPI000428EAE8|nr:stage VI sporulation protein F [Thermicanus aegyptius]